MSNRCYNCKYWMTQDNGYSNYTVLNTFIHCLKGHFNSIEESYSWKRTDDDTCDEFFKQAETCEDFNSDNSNQISMCVDDEIEDVLTSDEELNDLLRKIEL